MTMGDKASHDRSVFKLLNGDVRVWIEQEEIHMKAVDRGDPVELTPTMAKQLVAALLEMIAQVDD
jgi:hypothetical protein